MKKAKKIQSASCSTGLRPPAVGQADNLRRQASRHPGFLWNPADAVIGSPELQHFFGGHDNTEVSMSSTQNPGNFYVP
jgi:hypothetical protein